MRTDPFTEEYRYQNTGTNAEKYESLPDFPRLLDIELTNTCNMACLMCPTGMSNIKRLKVGDEKIRGFMNEFTFLKIIGEIKDRKTPIRFVRWGEPTMHPEFWWFVRKAKEFGIKVHLNTNGTILRQLREPIDSIKMSIHANSIRVREGIDALVTMNCYRTASITDKEAEDTGIDVTEYPFTALDEAKVYRQFKPGMDAPRLPNCPEVFDKLSIDWNGDVTMCCADYDGEMVIGNVLNDNLQDLWVSEEADNIRKTIVSGKHFEKFKICKNCFDLGCY